MLFDVVWHNVLTLPQFCFAFDLPFTFTQDQSTESSRYKKTDEQVPDDVDGQPSRASNKSDLDKPVDDEEEEEEEEEEVEENQESESDVR